MTGRKPLQFLKSALFVLLLSLTTTTLKAQAPPITDVAFAPDGSSVVACSQAGLQIFSWPDLELKESVELSFDNAHCVAFSADGNSLAVGGGNPSEKGAIEIFSWPECVTQMKLSQHDDSVVSVAWLDNDNLVSASLDRLLIHWDLESGEPARALRGHSRGVSSVCILSNGDLVSAGLDQSVRVWNTESGELTRSLNQHSRAINSISICPSGAGQPIVATAAGDHTIRFWQPSIGRMMRYVRLESEPLDLAWIDESRIVASCADGQLHLVDSLNVEVLHTTSAIDGWAYAVAVHPIDSSVVVAGSGGQLQRIELR